MTPGPDDYSNEPWYTSWREEGNKLPVLQAPVAAGPPTIPPPEPAMDERIAEAKQFATDEVSKMRKDNNLPEPDEEEEPLPEPTAPENFMADPGGAPPAKNTMESAVDAVTQNAAMSPETRAGAEKALEPAPPPPAPPPETPKQEPAAATLINAAPDWYKDEAPPDENLWIQALLGLGGAGLLAAVAPDARSAAAAGLGSLLNTGTIMATSPQRDYDRRLHAAKTQQEMQKLAKGDPLAQSKYDLSKARFDRMVKNDQDKADLDAAMHDKNSAVSRELQDAAVGAAWAPKNVGDFNGFQLDKMRVQAGQVAQQGRGQTNWNARQQTGYEADVALYGQKRQDALTDRALDKGEKIETEEREKIKGLESMERPGYKYVGKQPLNEAQNNRATTIISNSIAADDAYERLGEIYDSLSPLVKATPEFLTSWILSPENQDLISEMQTNVQAIHAAQRNTWDMGAPQPFELKILEEMMSAPTGIKTFMSQGAKWKGGRRSTARWAKNRLKGYSYLPDDGTSDQGPAATAPGGAGARAASVVDVGKQVIGQATDAAKGAAGAVGDAGTRAKDAAAKTVNDLFAPKPTAAPAAPAAPTAPAPTSQFPGSGSYNIKFPNGKIVTKPINSPAAYEAAKKHGEVTPANAR